MTDVMRVNDLSFFTKSDTIEFCSLNIRIS
ncbi:MAG: hypothetical protein ACI9HY_003690 [Planctomycetaceae bacterium]|jgi:hypothetical protein